VSYRWSHRNGNNGVPYLVDGKPALLDAGTNGHVLTLSGGDPVWAAPTGGGSDPWANVILGSDFTISTTANNNVTGLAFTPAASKRYLVEGVLLMRTATATTGPRPGIAWPTGIDDGASYIFAPSSNTASVQRWQGAKTTQNAASTGLPTTVDSYLGEIRAYFITGASPSGNFQITLASETAAVNVTIRAGSFIRYREVA
jgi:hypothetical protein